MGHAPEEDYGLYSGTRMTLSKHSLLKMEQRIKAYLQSGNRSLGVRSNSILSEVLDTNLKRFQSIPRVKYDP